MLPRGIRNHNPLNIRRSKDQWKGLAEAQNDRALTDGRLCSGSTDSKQASVCTRYDAEFCQFKSLEYGWRAAFYLLTRTYYHKYRLYTIRGIVSRWAPPQDNNDTSAYIANVSRLTGIDPDEPLGIPSEQPSRWMMLGAAMAIQENGTDSLDWFAMLRGWELLKQWEQSQACLNSAESRQKSAKLIMSPRREVRLIIVVQLFSIMLFFAVGILLPQSVGGIFVYIR